MEFASKAITRQLRAIARLDEARMASENDSITALEDAVRDEKLGRENAVAAYREHRRTHAKAQGA
jgi:hypothetical protein